MLNLNLKLQSSMLKGQVKTIDLEMRKLDARQALEHLAIVKVCFSISSIRCRADRIVQPYLLPSFVEEDSDAVDSLLFFERMSHKADLLSAVIDSNHNVADALSGAVPEDLVGICEVSPFPTSRIVTDGTEQVRSKLGRFSSLNKRFAAQLRRCTPDAFLKMGRVYREVSGTEKRLDAFIESLRKEELREADCGREIDGLVFSLRLVHSRLTRVIPDSSRKPSTSRRSISNNLHLIWSNEKSRTSPCWISTLIRSLPLSDSRSKRWSPSSTLQVSPPHRFLFGR